MKTNIKTSKTGFETVLKCMGALILLILLSSCAGVDAARNMRGAVSGNTLQRQDVISAYDLHKILTSRFGYVRIKLTDSQYTLPDNSKVARLCGPCLRDTIADKTPEPDGWDSDDYAIAAMVPLRNYAFGAMFLTSEDGTRHVVNLFVNDKKEVVFWDSKNAQLYQGTFAKPELILI